jgi:hypothetical protein
MQEGITYSLAAPQKLNTQTLPAVPGLLVQWYDPPTQVTLLESSQVTSHLQLEDSVRSPSKTNSTCDVKDLTFEDRCNLSTN